MHEEPNPRVTRLSIDERPGALPQITCDGADIAYSLVITGSRDRLRLVLRCDGAGEVWASLRRCG